MKRILAALVALSTLALAGCGEDTGAMSTPNIKTPSPNVRTICIGDYAFAIYSGLYKAGMAQIWENGPNGPRPMMCGKEGGEGNE